MLICQDDMAPYNALGLVQENYGIKGCKGFIDFVVVET